MQRLSRFSTIRPELLAFAPYSAGLTIAEIRERYGLSRIIKLASNESPLGVSPVVQRVLRDHASGVYRYPRVTTPELVRAIAGSIGVDPAMVVAGNGSDDIIDLLVRVMARPGVDHILTFDPTYTMYPIQASLCGVECRSVPLNPDFSFPLEALAAAADERTAMVVVVTPDNPSGYAATADALEELAGRLPPQALLLVDEAYVDFADPYEAHTLVPRLSRLPNAAVVRTMAKAYGLAGLRLGYGVMPPELADLILRVRLPFSVNILAEAAGIAAIEDTTFYRETQRVVREGRTFLSAGLAEAGCEVLPSQANFVMFRPTRDARAVFEALLARGVIVRHLGSYAMPDFIRVSIGTDEENRTFLQAFKEVLA